MKFRTIFALSAFLVFIAPASAQITPTPLGLLVRAGIFKPATGTGSAVGDSWFTAGAEVDIFRLNLGGLNPLSSKVTISVDTYSKGGASSIPVLLNYVGKADALKYSAGVGVSIARRPGFDTATKFAYQFSLGYDLPIPGVPLLAEVRYFGVTGVATSLDGFALTLGIRL